VPTLRAPCAAIAAQEFSVIIGCPLPLDGFSTLTHASKLCQKTGMRSERYIGGGIFGERYIRRLSLGRMPP